jgi:hypothetical protein
LRDHYLAEPDQPWAGTIPDQSNTVI